MVQNGKLVKSRMGTPQGEPKSPLLSNILLNQLDYGLEKRGHRFVKYADDCSIFLTSKRSAERVLEVNQKKTKIFRQVYFTLLGHGYIASYKKGDKDD